MLVWGRRRIRVVGVDEAHVEVEVVVGLTRSNPARRGFPAPR
jgi:hypothetical protein